MKEIRKNKSEVIRIQSKEYEGHKLIDLRVWYEDKETGEYKPTKKGISLMPDKVPGVIEGILKAMDVMGYGEK